MTSPHDRKWDILGRFRGSIDRRTREFVDFEDGDTLATAVRDMPPREREDQWELAGTVAARLVAVGVSEDATVIWAVEKWRRLLFGTPEPPFATIDEAEDWLKQRGVREPKLVSDPPGTAPMHVGLPEDGESSVYLPPAGGRYGRASMKAIEVRRARVDGDFSLPGERWYVGRDVFLKTLANGVELLAELVKCWSRGQTAAFILTGKVPDLPRWRVWLQDLPAGRRRAIVELYSPPNYREMRDLHQVIRKRLGGEGEKSFTPDDLDLIDFVGKTEGMTWEGRRLRWNSEHPERKPLEKYQSLLKAYKRAKERLGKP